MNTLDSRRVGGWKARVAGAVLMTGLVAAAAIGCSSEAPESASTESYSLEASAAAKSELGVQRWSVSEGGEHKGTIRGLSSDGREIVKLETTMVREGAVRFAALRYSRGEDATIIRAQVDDSGAMALDLDRTKAVGDDAVPRGLAIVVADLQAAKRVEGTQLSAASWGGGLQPKDSPQLTTGCPYLHQCNGLSQTLNCGNSTFNLTNCSLKGIVGPLEKGIKRIIDVKDRVDTADGFITCPDDIDQFFRDCMAYTGNGSTQDFGNGECGEGKACDSDETPTKPCPNPEHTECRAGCNGDGKACINSYGEPCASDGERKSWCCSGSAIGNTCGPTCTPAGQRTVTSKGGLPCCAGLVQNNLNVCTNACTSTGGSCSKLADCCMDNICLSGKCQYAKQGS